MIYFSGFPSTHALGPANTIAALGGALSQEFDVTLLTQNFDYSRREALHKSDNVTVRESPGFTTLYASRSIRRWLTLHKYVTGESDAVTIHCLYDPRMSIPALLISLIARPDRKIIHMPHGIFMDVIQTKHRLRKRLLCAFLNWRPVRARVIHVASSEREMAEVKKRVGRDAEVALISHFFGDFSAYWQMRAREKTAGSLKIGFVGRIAEQKNLKFAIEALAAAGVAGQLNVFGEASDAGYVQACKDLAEERGVSELITFRGVVPKEDLYRELVGQDLVFSPTRGENFGQAILEALSLGAPVLLSNETPWLDVAAHDAGWAFDLADMDAFVSVLRFAFAADDDVWSRYRQGARRYALAKNRNRENLQEWLSLVERTLERSGAGREPRA